MTVVDDVGVEQASYLHRSIVGLALLAFLLWAWGASRVNEAAMSDAGLISVLGWQVLAAFTLLAGAVALALSQRRLSAHLLAGLLVQFVVMLQGLTALVEPQAGYFTAYLHVGFVEQIAQTGQTIPGLDARFSWPGTFALGALISKVAGVESARYFLRWAPVLFNLAYLAPLWLIARTFTRDERVRWLALWLFVATNWFHQDYYSPQALNYFLYLTILAIVLRWFAYSPVHGRRFIASAGEESNGLSKLFARLPRWASADAEAGAEALPRKPPGNAVLLGWLVLLSACMVVSHQLTPVALILVLAALVTLRRCAASHLPLVVLLLFAGWFAVGASGFWLGHLDELTGGAGKLSKNLGASLASRVSGSPTRLWVLRLRIVLSFGLLALAGLGGIWRWRRVAPPVAMVALALPPFLLVGGQSYGGEVLLRSYLLALPASCLLAAFVLRAGLPPHRWGSTQRPAWSGDGQLRRTGLSVLTTAIVLALLATAGLTARFGNEHFERVGTNDLAAVQWLYTNVDKGSTLIVPARNTPWRYQDLADYQYRPADEQSLPTARAVLAEVPSDVPAYLLTTAEQQLFGEDVEGLPAGWLDKVRADLQQTGRLEQVFALGDARVYRVVPAPPTATGTPTESGGS